MKTLRNITVIVILLNIILVRVGKAYAETNLEKQEKALKVIENFADNLCSIPIGGQYNNFDLSGNVNVEVKKLISNLAELGVDGAAKYQSSKWEGLLQKDIAGLLEKKINCKKEIWRDLKDRMLKVEKTSNQQGKKSLQKEASHKNSSVTGDNGTSSESELNVPPPARVYFASDLDENGQPLDELDSINLSISRFVIITEWKGLQIGKEYKYHIEICDDSGLPIYEFDSKVRPESWPWYTKDMLHMKGYKYSPGNWVFRSKLGNRVVEKRFTVAPSFEKEKKVEMNSQDTCNSLNTIVEAVDTNIDSIKGVHLGLYNGQEVFTSVSFPGATVGHIMSHKLTPNLFYHAFLSRSTKIEEINNVFDGTKNKFNECLVGYAQFVLEQTLNSTRIVFYKDNTVVIIDKLIKNSGGSAVNHVALFVHVDSKLVSLYKEIAPAQK